MKIRTYLIILSVLLISGCTSLFYGGIPAYYEKTAKKQGYPVIVNRIQYSEPDSINAVDLKVYYKNISGKILKDVLFKLKAYDSKDNVLPCTISGDAVFEALSAGPIYPGDYRSEEVWENAWISPDIDKVKIVGVEISFQDGTDAVYYSDRVGQMVFER